MAPQYATEAAGLVYDLIPDRASSMLYQVRTLPRPASKYREDSLALSQGQRSCVHTTYYNMYVIGAQRQHHQMLG